MVRLVVLLSLVMFGTGLHAQLRDVCRGFDVELRSASGDATEDDLSVALHFGKKKVSVALDPALYTPRHTLKNVDNLCSKLTAIEVRPQRVLLLLSKNMRPSLDQLDAVLIDTQAQKVLDVLKNVGEIKSGNNLFVLRRQNDQSLDVRLVHETLAGSGCDCPEAAIEEWSRLVFMNDKIAKRSRDEMRERMRDQRQQRGFGSRRRPAGR
jgi:hypothetical protein